MTKIRLDASARGPVLGGSIAFGAPRRGTSLPSYVGPTGGAVHRTRVAVEPCTGSDVRPFVLPTLPNSAVNGVSVRSRRSTPV